MARRKIIAGNWKMNKTPSQAVELINTLKPLVATEDAEMVIEENKELIAEKWNEFFNKNKKTEVL